MKKIKTYYINRNGVNIWLGQGIQPKETDTVVEERDVFVADEGKVLKDGEDLYKSIWTNDISRFKEIDEPIIIEEETMEEEEDVGTTELTEL